MSALNYLAYGSNLHPLRLRERVPSARPSGVVTLSGYSLRFHKRGADASGKCDLVCGDPAAKAFGALYRIDAAEKHLLDRVEGVGNGYELVKLHCVLEGVSVDAFGYAATQSHIQHDLRPYHWYKELVLAGARCHGLPAAYLARIETVNSIDDPDAARDQIHQALLQRIAAYDPRNLS